MPRVPVPAFIRDLRAHVGHGLLWLPGVTAVVPDGSGRLLLVRRADTGRWALPSGIPEPGEQMAVACAREVAEETGVGVRVERLLHVLTEGPKTYPNGDRCQFVDHAFLCTPVRGEAHVADDESTAVTWVPLGDVPALPGTQDDALARWREDREATWFLR